MYKYKYAVYIKISFWWNSVAENQVMTLISYKITAIDEPYNSFKGILLQHRGFQSNILLAWYADKLKISTQYKHNTCI